MATATFDAVDLSTGDDMAFQIGDADVAWPPPTPGGAANFFIEKGNYTTFYQVANGVLRFNTGSLVGATINSAQIKLNISTRNDGDAIYSLVADYSTALRQANRLIAAQVSGSYSLTIPGASIFTAIRVNALTIGLNTITLTDISGINPGGMTAIRFTLDNPNSDAAPAGHNDILTSGTNQLVVDYTDGVVPTTAYNVPPSRVY